MFFSVWVKHKTSNKPKLYLVCLLILTWTTVEEMKHKCWCWRKLDFKDLEDVSNHLWSPSSVIRNGMSHRFFTSSGANHEGHMGQFLNGLTSWEKIWKHNLGGWSLLSSSFKNLKEVQLLSSRAQRTERLKHQSGFTPKCCLSGRTHLSPETQTANKLSKYENTWRHTNSGLRATCSAK